MDLLIKRQGFIFICILLLASVTLFYGSNGKVAASLEEGESFFVRFDVQLTKQETGSFTLKINPSWAPLGAERFEELVDEDFFHDARFFRVISGFMAQFGINADPMVSSKWRSQSISDDPVLASNKRGTISFATSGKDSRTTQLFINFKDNTFLDSSGFSPIGEVVDGMEVVDQLYAGYGEGAPSGRGPAQNLIQMRGNIYLEESFPELSYILATEKVAFPSEQGVQP
mmetsp:Transcript_2317/g.3236  ORF Transcript_2317/g.3236 Transcript_2317/m.3236 type:complete len:228 (+) Transcript_2317:68-751(+)